MTDPLQNLNPPAIHDDAQAGRGKAVRKSLADLVLSIKEKTFDMAILLAESRKYVHSWGFESVVDYGTRELGLKPRKVQYLIHMVDVCDNVGVPRKDYEPAGITKLREITRLNPEEMYWNPETKTNEDMNEHIVNLIAEAPDMTVQQVEDAVARLLGQTGEDARVTRSYNTTRSAYERVIKAAIELAKNKLGTKARDAEGMAVDYSDGDCLEVICAEYLADPNNSPTEIVEVKEEINVPHTEESVITES